MTQRREGDVITVKCMTFGERTASVSGGECIMEGDKLGETIQCRLRVGDLIR